MLAAPCTYKTLQQPLLWLQATRQPHLTCNITDMCHVCCAARCQTQISQDTFRMAALVFQAVHSICFLCKPGFLQHCVAYIAMSRTLVVSCPAGTCRTTPSLDPCLQQYLQTWSTCKFSQYCYYLQTKLTDAYPSCSRTLHSIGSRYDVASVVHKPTLFSYT